MTMPLSARLVFGLFALAAFFVSAHLIARALPKSLTEDERGRVVTLLLFAMLFFLLGHDLARYRGDPVIVWAP